MNENATQLMCSVVFEVRPQLTISYDYLLQIPLPETIFYAVFKYVLEEEKGTILRGRRIGQGLVVKIHVFHIISPEFSYALRRTIY